MNKEELELVIRVTDNNQFEKEGLILRTYVGAKLKRNYSYYKSLGSRIDENIPQKEIIAEKSPIFFSFNGILLPINNS